MRGVRSYSLVDVPEGWGAATFFGRVVTAGLCTYDKLVDGTLTVAAVFAMHRILDIREYYQAKAMEKAPEKVPDISVEYLQRLFDQSREEQGRT